MSLMDLKVHLRSVVDDLEAAYEAYEASQCDEDVAARGSLAVGSFRIPVPNFSPELQERLRDELQTAAADRVHSLWGTVDLLAKQALELFAEANQEKAAEPDTTAESESEASADDQLPKPRHLAG